VRRSRPDPLLRIPCFRETFRGGGVCHLLSELVAACINIDSDKAVLIT
jgi:hypothetical protein